MTDDLLKSFQCSAPVAAATWARFCFLSDHVTMGEGGGGGSFDVRQRGRVWCWGCRRLLRNLVEFVVLVRSCCLLFPASPPSATAVIHRGDAGLWAAEKKTDKQKKKTRLTFARRGKHCMFRVGEFEVFSGGFFLISLSL